VIVDCGEVGKWGLKDRGRLARPHRPLDICTSINICVYTGMYITRYTYIHI